jgi:hypothetical protein
MKDRIYLVSPQFVEEKVQKIFELLGEIGFISRLGLVTGPQGAQISMKIYDQE